jgi:DNA polymerase-4
MRDSSLKGKCVAVCGDVNERHGIVLAKNYEAKKFGVQTGEAIWQAKQKCPDLVTVLPHYEEYLKFSRLGRSIFERYTDRIEPFGMDESWLDVTGSGIFGDGEKIAEEIRAAAKSELGITISCGVSFNKVFAKLGSDMKKPDATTVIPKNRFRELTWSLPAGEMIGVGRATTKWLKKLGIHTIGQLANTDPEVLYPFFKSRAYQLHAFANGEDYSLVLHKDIEVPAKSVGHGTTTLQDLENPAEVWGVMLGLVQDIGRKLRIFKKKATGVSIYIRDNELFTKQWQCQLPIPTRSPGHLARAAFHLFERSYPWERPIRSVTISAIQLIDEDVPLQHNLFFDVDRLCRFQKADDVMYELQERFGEDIVLPARLVTKIKMQRHRTDVRMPTGMTTMRS